MNRPGRRITQAEAVANYLFEQMCANSIHGKPNAVLEAWYRDALDFYETVLAITKTK
jgi:hypothetical protein